MTHKCVLLAGLLSALAGAVALAKMPNLLSARSTAGSSGAPRVFAVQYAYPPPPYDYYGNTGASTAFGSAAQGMAQVIGAKGSYNLQTAQGAVFAEEALSKDIDNRKKSTETYFEMRNINEAYQAAHRSPRLSKEQYARMAAVDAPKRLTTSQFDPASGKIAWPDLLQETEYETYRASLDSLFAERASASGGSGSQIYRSIRDYCKQMLQQLRTHSGDVPEQISSREYMGSKYFIDSLAYEAQAGR